MSAKGYPQTAIGKSSTLTYVNIGCSQKNKPGTEGGYTTSNIGKSSTLTYINIGASQKAETANAATPSLIKITILVKSPTVKVIKNSNVTVASVALISVRINSATASSQSAKNSTATPTIKSINIIANAVTAKVTKSAFVDLNEGIDSFTKLMLHLDGTNGSTTFIDSETTPKTVTRAGSTVVSTAQSVFGGSSGLFTAATSDYLSVADSADWDWGSGAFTIDCRFRINSMPGAGSRRVLASQTEVLGTDNFNGFYIYYFNDGSILFRTNNGGSTFALSSSAGAVTTNTWYHLAVVRNVNRWDLYLDGVSVANGSDSRTVTPAAAAFEIGRGTDTLVTYFHDGYIDEFRVSNGIARNFIPPTAAYSNGVVPRITVVAKTATASTANRATATPSTAFVTLKINAATGSTSSGGGTSATATPALKIIKVLVNASAASTNSFKNSTATPSIALVTFKANASSSLSTASRTASPSVSVTRVVVNTPNISANRNASATPSVSITRVVVNNPTVRVMASRIVNPTGSSIRVLVFTAIGAVSGQGIGLAVSILLKSKIEKIIVSNSRIDKYLYESSRIDQSIVLKSKI